MSHLVYLSGLNARWSQEYIGGWREYVRARLPEPIQTLCLLSEMGRLLGDVDRVQGQLDQDAPAVTPDRFEIARADMVLVNVLGASRRIDLQTVLEVGRADALRKPIVLVIEQAGSPYSRRDFVNVASHVVGRLDEALEIVVRMLLPEPKALLPTPPRFLRRRVLAEDDNEGFEAALEELKKGPRHNLVGDLMGRQGSSRAVGGGPAAN